ncbi:Tetraacyldisaccharide 4'-kinase [Gluconacetobacter sp. SXCC-1]|uniref:Tetraacyldisaccharide 4'-kinase n=1 Tax=Komagataeibacter rhaeticus TaxID=215221 RepID=A0A181CBA7_9PROT|nr:tetraacyldisaccharide 4'-kinase [Komagataeibacter rhaeticus]ATU72537.1 tetraacyldisaccharide 4'-kinase [Komagataeibacter xylinus]EGG74513.1 Tetraacyldisaccharide 4'-kinase [Gluconacetobacter sp. SXCC-1]QIP35549.1 tetraacyldisaccharide 4'-kinase [Komagataeibacter rhaeticus]QOC45303.1 tetraacyldisaccharide 4'-kinase [Komagataeibacter rhaeticus]WPP22289.1 tetraacyldisaccharide 4'-kinase [Komagataeibacter rhaeticus]
MRAPAFWWRPPSQPGARARLLAPLGWLYGAATAYRMRGAGWSAPVPVLCCGNIGAGGAGKTPLALDLAQRAIARGRRPAFLSRGYGGRMTQGIRVDPARHTARDVGDEPLLLARIAPCHVGANRARAARQAIAEGADCLIMDDGLQNPTLCPDIALVVVNGRTGFGNGRVLPAGPLREPVPAGLARAQGVVVIGPDEYGVTRWLEPGLPCFTATLRQDVSDVPRGRPVIAFAGIAHPARFFDGLARAGIPPVRCVGFADHHPYTPADWQHLRTLATRQDACLVTTLKDAVRLPASWRRQVHTVGLALAWNDAAMPERILDLWLDRKDG